MVEQADRPRVDLLSGGLPPGTKDLKAARERIADALVEDGLLTPQQVQELLEQKGYRVRRVQ